MSGPVYQSTALFPVSVTGVPGQTSTSWSAGVVSNTLIAVAPIPSTSSSPCTVNGTYNAANSSLMVQSSCLKNGPQTIDNVTLQSFTLNGVATKGFVLDNNQIGTILGKPIRNFAEVVPAVVTPVAPVVVASDNWLMWVIAVIVIIVIIVIIIAIIRSRKEKVVVAKPMM